MERVSVYLLKKTVRERKDSSPSPELMLAKTTPRNAEVHVSGSSGEGQGPLKSSWIIEKCNHRGTYSFVLQGRRSECLKLSN